MDEANLNMDNRFKNIEQELNFSSSASNMEEAFQVLDNHDLDQAFVSGSALSASNYSADYWNEYLAKEQTYYQDANFQDATKLSKSQYESKYWVEAEKALAEGGLNFRYQSAYWKEAETLLLAANKKTFFKRWAAIASILLLIGISSSGLISKFNKEMPLNETNLSNINKHFLRPVNPISTNPIADIITSKTDLPKTNNSNIKNNISSNHSRSNNQLTSRNLIENQTISRNPIINSKNPDIKITSSEAGSTEIFKPNKRSEIPKIKRNLPTEILIASKMTDDNESLIGIKEKSRNRFINIGLKIGSGLGNSIRQNEFLSLRQNIESEFSFKLPRKNIPQFNFILGVNREFLNGFSYSEGRVRHLDAGPVNHYNYQYNFKSVLKGHIAIITKFDISKRQSINFGLGIEKYLTAELEMIEKENDIINNQDYAWGVNSVFNTKNKFVRIGYEYAINEFLFVNVDSKIGFNNKINPIYKTESTQKEKSITISLKYKIFN